MAKRRKRRGKNNYNRSKAISPTKIESTEVALKSWSSSSLPLGFWGGTGINRNIIASKGGAAVSYVEVHEVNASINAIIRGLKILPWTITLYPDGIRKDGKEIARSNDLKTRHPFQQSAMEFQQENGISLLDTIAWSWLLYGEVYIELVKNQFGFKRGFEWLNPVGVQVIFDREITEFQYGWQNEFIPFPPESIAYWHNRNPQNDFIGLPTVVTLLPEINIIRNLDRFLNAYFINDATPGAYATPASREDKLSEREMELLRNSQRSEHKGTDKSFRFEWFPIPMSITALDQPDLVKNVALDENEAKNIFEGFGVDRAILGNTTGSPYKDQREWFWPATVIPLARLIENFVNLQLIPFVDNSGDIVFEYDTSAFDQTSEGDLLEAQLINGQVTTSYLSLFDAAKKQELEPDIRLKDMYMIQGIPVHISEFKDYNRNQQLIAPSVFNVPLETGEPLSRSEGQEVSQELEVAEEVAPLEGGESETGDESAGKSHEHDDMPDYIGKLYEGDDLFPDSATVDKRIADELRQWAKFTTKSWGKKNARQFEPHYLPDEYKWAVWDVLDTLDNKADIHKHIMDILSDPMLKSINTFRSNLQNAARRHWRGLSGKTEFESRLDRAIKREFPLAFERGLKEFDLTLDDITKAERDVLDSFISDEVGRIGGLSDFIQAHSKEDGGLLNSVRGRVEMWINRIPELEELGKVVGARTEKLEWVFDPRKDHCLDCRFLNGKVYAGFTWMTLRTQKNIYPRSRGLKCKGFRCGCEIKKTDKRITPGRLALGRLG